MNILSIFAAAGVALLVDYSIRRDPAVFVVQQLPVGFNAVTIPPLGIFIKKEQATNRLLLLHELVHWKQYQDRGLLPFYLDYFFERIIYGYDLMPMEIEARYLETRECALNYTQFVRDGLAITVRDPGFRM